MPSGKSKKQIVFQPCGISSNGFKNYLTALTTHSVRGAASKVLARKEAMHPSGSQAGGRHRQSRERKGVVVVYGWREQFRYPAHQVGEPRVRLHPLGSTG